MAAWARISLIFVACLSSLHFSRSTRSQQSEKRKKLRETDRQQTEGEGGGRRWEVRADTPANRDASLWRSMQTANSVALGGVAPSFHE